MLMTTYRIAFHLWLDGGRKGPLGPALDAALDATVEAARALGRGRR